MPLTFTARAVLFDLDGVLVDSRAVVERTWQRWAQRHAVDPAGLVQQAHGRRSIETVRAVAPHLDAAAEAAWLEQVELGDTDGLVALPGALDLYRSVPAERRSVVTSGGRQLALLRLRACGFEVPRVLVAAEDVRRGKPAPEGYETAAARLSVRTADCVVIEDTAPGVAAGAAAGARVIAVEGTARPADLAAALALVRSLEWVRISPAPGCLRVQLP